MSNQGVMDYAGGTVVDLPPASSSSNTQTKINTTTSSEVNNNDIVNTISKRRAKMDERKRELLLEARSARIEWIHSGGEDDDEDDTNNNTSANNTNLLTELQACTSDILPCAPQIIESMLSSNCDWRRQYNKSSSASRNNGALRQVIEKQNLSWKLVKKVNNTDEEVKVNDASAAVQNNSSLGLPSIPSSQYYTNFLNTLCEPSAANLVISIQQFCKTIHEAANVMVESMSQTDNNKDAKESGDGATKTPSADQHNHGTSLAKAVRGFINKTIREMEDHEAFHDCLYPQKQEEHQQDGDIKPIINEAAREELLASLEKFVYTKCRHDIDKVLLTACEEVQVSKSMKTLEMELHDKMLSLQFVTPSHLEIQSLKKIENGNNIDLSYIIQQIQSIHGQSSPRQMLQCILSAHRGVSFALDKACGGRDPPGADDILPTLILATLRSHPKHLLSSLRFIEDFAPMPLLRGEMGYAYTNLCGAMQFIRELDIDGHMAEVISLEGTGEKSAVLSIGPEEFRLGLELCRRKIEENAESLNSNTDGDIEDGSNENVDDESAKKSLLNFDIKARDVRKARSKGETIDLDWALKKQSKSFLQQGKVTNDAKNPDLQQLNLPPEEPPLPSQFSRSYSFLTTHPDNIGIRDLPKLLKEYKMLVHATEKLLNERSVWREGERKRQMRAERHKLEQDFIDYVGIDENDSSAKLANGH